MEKTPEELMAEANEGNPLGGRKITFSDQCGAFAALYGGQMNQVVARAFGLSVQTVSNLSGCLGSDPDPYRSVRLPKDNGDPGSNDDPGRSVKLLMDHNRNRARDRRPHYQAVAAEFEALGREEFNRRYYTPRIHNRIIQAKEAIRLERTK